MSNYRTSRWTSTSVSTGTNSWWRHTGNLLQRPSINTPPALARLAAELQRHRRGRAYDNDDNDNDDDDDDDDDNDGDSDDNYDNYDNYDNDDNDNDDSNDNDDNENNNDDDNNDTGEDELCISNEMLDKIWWPLFWP